MCIYRYAHYDNIPSFGDFSAFAGWTKPYAKQYGGVDSCGYVNLLIHSIFYAYYLLITSQFDLSFYSINTDLNYCPSWSG